MYRPPLNISPIETSVQYPNELHHVRQCINGLGQFNYAFPLLCFRTGPRESVGGDDAYDSSDPGEGDIT